MIEPTPHRSQLPTSQKAAFVLAAVLVIATGALLGQGFLQTTPGGPGSGAPTSSGGSSAPGASATPSSPSADWAALQLGDLPAVAALAPTSAGDAAGIATNDSFTLTSRNGESAVALAERITVTPATDLKVRPGAGAVPVTATLTPTAPLAGGTTYRLTLRAPDGTLAASWAYHVRGPVRVQSTIPGDRATGVPADTGVEVAFDQDDVADMADHFSIQPAVKGRFERHGRTQVFVPNARLESATVYTVTIKAGVRRTGTDLRLESDVVFRFETAGTSTAQTYVFFGREVIEASPATAPSVGVIAHVTDDADGSPGTPPSKANVAVYRFASLDAAEQALATFLALPRWTDYSPPLLPTDGLPVAARFGATLGHLTEDAWLLRFPEPLAKGWYLVELSGQRPAQAFLQVTPVSAWVSVLTDKTVAWVNDVTTGRPLPGAIASLDGAALGRADADGLLVADTPASLIPPGEMGDEPTGEVPPILRVRSAAGDTVLVPFEVSTNVAAYRGEWWEKSESADATFWSMLFTDRSGYRTDDRIEAWGYLRSRDGNHVPSSVELRLVAATGDAGRGLRPSIVSSVVTPSAHGSLTGSLSFAGLPTGQYEVQAVVDGRVVCSSWVEVTIIRKPAYRLSLTADHRAVIVGTQVTWTAVATFYEGSTVPSLPLRFHNLTEGDEDGRLVRTDASGRVASAQAAAAPASRDSAWEEPDSWDVQVRPAGEEQAEIEASADILVFPSAYDLQAGGAVKSGTLTVSGTLSRVDLTKVEHALAAGTYVGDAAGARVAGATVDVEVTELVPVRTQTGTQYDFVNKVFVPVYEYDINRVPVGSRTVTTTAKGGISLSMAVPSSTYDYEVVLSTHDTKRRLQVRTIIASPPSAADQWTNSGITFRTARGKSPDSVAYSIGDRISWQMIDDGRSLPSGGDHRYLYLVAQRGLVAADVTDSSTFKRTFQPSDAPGVFVVGVRFTGTSYAPKAADWATYHTPDRNLKVKISLDKARYRPGETATVSVRTARADGRPVAASVVVQAVDEKLYAMGLAVPPTPLEDLYRKVDSGIVRLTATHQVPTNSGPEGEGGDTTGGGGEPRGDFRDTLLFRALETDANGRATTTVKLSDDLTSWRVVAGAVTADLRAGAGSVLVPVGLPFFVEATIADSYLVADRPIVQLRAYGTALKSGDRVDFTVSSPSLGLAPTRVTGKAFESVPFELPALTVARHSLEIAATTTSRTGPDRKLLTDALVRPFDVVRSRLTAARQGFTALADGLPSVPTDAGMATYTFTDDGRGRLLPLLASLAEPAGSRIDRGLAQSIARSLLIAEFGRDGASLPPLTFDVNDYSIGFTHDDNGAETGAGAALFPYAGVDPVLAARIAALAPESVARTEIRDVLLWIRDRETTQRDLAIATLAGLASLGDPVLPDLQAAAREPDLTPGERIDLALGFAAAGDEPSAAAIERDLLARHGQRLGPWVRLDVGDPSQVTDATARLAVVAAAIGDPLATDLAEYVVANEDRDSAPQLELAAYAARVLERTPATPASFAYTVDGKRTVVSLKAGESFTLALTGGQRASLSVERVSGSVGIAAAWREAVPASSITPSSETTIVRTIPAGPIAADKLVVVTLDATFKETAPEGCYDVVETVPSGLAPTEIRLESNEGRVIPPSSVVGQQVTFCAPYDKDRHSLEARLRYVARVVNAGTFAWEPAVMQLGGAWQEAAITGSGTVTIAR